MKMYELLDTPEKWTKGASARNGDTIPCPPLSPEACSFCLLGAMSVCHGDDYYNVRHALTQRVGEFIHKWNDAPERTYEEVIILLKELDL